MRRAFPSIARGCESPSQSPPQATLASVPLFSAHERFRIVAQRQVNSRGVRAPSTKKKRPQAVRRWGQYWLETIGRTSSKKQKLEIVRMSLTLIKPTAPHKGRGGLET